MSFTTYLTYVLPHRLLSSVARKLAYSPSPRIKQWLIDTVTRKFGVDLGEAAPVSYTHLDARVVHDQLGAFHREDAHLPHLELDPRELDIRQQLHQRLF